MSAASPTHAGQQPAHRSLATAALQPADAQAFAAHLQRSRRRRNQRKATTPAVDPVLLDDCQAAALFSISVDQFLKARRAAWFKAQAVEFSPRCCRWVAAELVAQVAGMPRRAAP